MIPRIRLATILFIALSLKLLGHNVPIASPTGPMHVRGNQFADSTGQQIGLRGVQISGLNVADPDNDPVAQRNLQAMTALTFGTIREVWNMNTVRLPVASAIWERDGQSYLDRVASVVKKANDAGLIVVLAEFDDAGLPSPAVADFWRAWASFFKDNPLLVFDIYNQPAAANIPGHAAGRRQSSDWQFWLHGGVAANGQTAAGMQDLVDAIRAAGAPQLIAVSSLDEGLGFQGLTANDYIRDPDILYEVHAYYDEALTDRDRDADFGFLASRFPVYVGEWGVPFNLNRPSCQNFPSDVQGASTVLLQSLSFYDTRLISWTASSFEPSSLIQDFDTYAPTTLDQPWTCGQVSAPQPGIGEILLLWLTGDPQGFGTIEAVTFASAGPLAPTGVIAPGEMLAIFRQQSGPFTPAYATPDASGNLPTTLSDTQVLFDGTPAPLSIVSLLGINLQAPYELAGKTSTVIQVVYKNVPCAKVTVAVMPSVPSIMQRDFTTTAMAQNQNGSPNSSVNPAALSSTILLTATGVGLLSPPRQTGTVAQEPYGEPAVPISLLVGGVPAEIQSVREAPGTAGVVQIIAKLPNALPVRGTAAQSYQLALTVGEQTSQQNNIVLWVR